MPTYGSWGLTGWRPPTTHRCYLCGAAFPGPFRAGLEAHRAECPRRQIERPCGVCGQPIPPGEHLGRKFHRGDCATEGQRRMLARAKPATIPEPAPAPEPEPKPATAGPTLAQIQRMVRKANLAGDDASDPTFRCAVLLVASFILGQDERALSDFTGDTLTLVRSIARRWRRYRIWLPDGKFGLDALPHEKEFGLALSLAVLVGMGLVVRIPDQEGGPHD